MRGIYRQQTNNSDIGTLCPYLIFALAAIFFSFMANSTAMAATAFQGSLKSVSIADAVGTNTPPTAKFTYSINGTTVSFDGTGSTDSDGSIAEYKWDFGDGTTASGATATHAFASLTGVRVSLMVKDNNGAVTIVQNSVTSQTPVNISVNFQPATSSIPTGFVADSGAAYSDTKGYGWVTLPNSLGTRDRDSSLSASQAYDTFIHVAPTGVWEYKLANGTYKVKVVVGDPTYPDETSAVQAEKQVVIPATTLSGSTLWVEKQATVVVSDQKLTLTFSGSTIAKICWVQIFQ